MAELFRRPDGTMFEATDHASVQTARGLGYEPLAAQQAKASAEDLARYKKMQEDYGGFTGAVAATFHNFKNTLLPGLEGAGARIDEALFGKEFAQARKQERDVITEQNPIASAAGVLAGAGAAMAALPVTGIATGAAIGAAQVKGAQYDRAVDDYLATPKGIESTTQGFFELEAKTLKEGNLWALLGATLGGASGAVAKYFPKTAPFKRSPLEKNIPELTKNQLATRGLDTVAEDIILSRKLMDKTVKEAKNELQSVITASNGVMNIAKGETKSLIMNPDRWIDVKSRLGSLLKTQKSNPAAARVLRVLKKGVRPNAQNLHKLRSELGEAVESLTEAGVKETDAAYGIVRAYDFLQDELTGFMRETAGDAAAESFRLAQKQQSAALRLMRTFSGVEENTAVRTVSGILQYGSAAAGYGMGGFVGGAVGAGVGANLAAPVSRTLPGMLERGGEFFLRNEENILKAVNLATKGAVAGVTGYQNLQLSVNHVQNMQAQMSEVAMNPDKFTERVRTALDNKGIKGPLADAVTMKVSIIANHLNEKAPKNTTIGMTLSPQVQRLTKQQARQYSEHVEAAFNPSAALANPTPRKIETLDAIYPETMASIRYVVGNQVAEQGVLNKAQRDWASKILKSPATKLAIPKNMGIISGAVNSAQQQGIGGPQGPAPGPQKPYAPQARTSEMTTSQRLAGGVNRE